MVIGLGCSTAKPMRGDVLRCTPACGAFGVSSGLYPSCASCAVPLYFTSHILASSHRCIRRLLTLSQPDSTSSREHHAFSCVRILPFIRGGTPAAPSARPRLPGKSAELLSTHADARQWRCVCEPRSVALPLAPGSRRGAFAHHIAHAETFQEPWKHVPAVDVAPETNVWVLGAVTQQKRPQDFGQTQGQGPVVFDPLMYIDNQLPGWRARNCLGWCAFHFSSLIIF